MGSLPPDMELFIPNLPMACFTSLLVIYEPYRVGFLSGFAFLGSGLCADASIVCVPGLSYTGGAFFLRCALSLVLERFLLDLIGVSA